MDMLQILAIKKIITMTIKKQLTARDEIMTICENCESDFARRAIDKIVIDLFETSHRLDNMGMALYKEYRESLDTEGDNYATD